MANKRFSVDFSLLDEFDNLRNLFARTHGIVDREIPAMADVEVYQNPLRIIAAQTQLAVGAKGSNGEV